MPHYPETLHVSAQMSENIGAPVDRAVISSRPGGGNTTQSYLKGDIIADNLNAVFGPLGWEVEADIHQIDDWNETKQKQNAQVNMHVVQVVSNVKLTIKKTTETGSDTVFKQPGIGYGEVEEGKSRKEAFGMAVKGSATDGFKRCASLLGKRFGMMMASNGKQDDLEYAHNGKPQNLKAAQRMREEDSRRSKGNDDARGAPRHDEATARGASVREDPSRGNAQREQAPRDRQEEANRDRPRQAEAPARNDTRNQQQNTETKDRPRNDDTRAKADASKDNAAGSREKSSAKEDAAQKAGTNYPLDNLPITLDDMTSFGATLVERVKEMRQMNDKVGLVRQHINTIKNVDAKIRKRIIERLDELGVDVNKITS